MLNSPLPLERRRRIIVCRTDREADAFRAAGFKSVRVVEHAEQVMTIRNREPVPDERFNFFDEIVLAFSDGDEELRDGIAARLDDTKCRWIDWAAHGGSPQRLFAEGGTIGLIEAVTSARPMWVDEVCLLSDIPDSGPPRPYTCGLDGLDAHGFRIIRPVFWPVIGPYGPLPGYAEFWTQTGWKRLDAWRAGDVGLVCDPETGRTHFEEVGRVVHDAPDGFLHLRNSGTTDIVACANHRWPVVGKDGKHRVFTTSELAERGEGEHGSGYQLIRTFLPPELPDLPLTDDEIRLRVAVCADGSIRSRMRQNRISVCIRKDRKKVRIEYLLRATGTTFRTRSYPKRPTEVYYDFDGHEDKRLRQFLGASPRQLRVVFDELQHWDGHVYRGARLVLSTSDPDDAAFCEYLFSACGYRASRFAQNSKPETQRDNYLVCANQRGAKSRCNWDLIESAPSADGKKYCLTTSVGFFVCRLGPGQIYVTGNSGKSVLIRQIACNLLRLHGWRTLITSFEEKVKPRYQRDLRRHLIGEEITSDRDGVVSWRPKFESSWTAADVAAADAEIEHGFRFLRRKRGAILDMDRLLDRIHYAVRVYGVEVVIIDPVNEIDHQVPRGESKTDYMGRFMIQLKQLADDYHLVMIVLAHPPKDGVEKRSSKGKLLTLNDAADTAHYGNKADIGWAVWRPSVEGATYLNVDKLKDHDVMGKPTLAKLVLNQLTGGFTVQKVGYDAVLEELMGE